MSLLRFPAASSKASVPFDKEPGGLSSGQIVF